MNFLDMFNEMEAVQPLSPDVVDSSYESQYREDPPPCSNWGDEFGGIKTSPVLYNLDGYISPFASNNWGCASGVLGSVVDDSRLPALSDKVDPNRIFNADMAAFRALAADQLKIAKLFEKKLMDGLMDRNKYELTENDIMAMQALTAARSAVTGINKEQVAIKKSIAELKLKQQANSNSATRASTDGTQSSGGGYSSMDLGRSILDSIFDAPTSTMTTPDSNSYQNANSDSAGDILDEMIPGNGYNSHIKYENESPTTYIIAGMSDDDYEFQTYNSDGTLIEGYPNPTSTITNIDRENKIATDEYLKQYPVKFK